MTLRAIQLPPDSDVENVPQKRFLISGQMVTLTPYFFSNPESAWVNPATRAIDEATDSGWPCTRTDFLKMIVKTKPFNSSATALAAGKAGARNSGIARVPIIQADFFASAIQRAAASTLVQRINQNNGDISSATLTEMVDEAQISNELLTIESVASLLRIENHVFFGTFFGGDSPEIAQTRFDNLLPLADEITSFLPKHIVDAARPTLKLADLTQVICSTEIEDRELCKHVDAAEINGEALDKVMQNYLRRSDANFTELSQLYGTSTDRFVLRQVVKPQVAFQCSIERVGTEAQLGMLLLALEKFAEAPSLGDFKDLGFGRFDLVKFSVMIDDQEISIFAPRTHRLGDHLLVQSARSAALRDTRRFALDIEKVRIKRC